MHLCVKVAFYIQRRDEFDFFKTKPWYGQMYNVDFFLAPTSSAVTSWSISSLMYWTFQFSWSKKTCVASIKISRVVKMQKSEILCLYTIRVIQVHFSIINFHYLCRNILALPAYGVYIAVYSVCKRVFDIGSVFSSRQSTDKQVDVAEVSTVSFTGSFPQILWSLQPSYLPIQPFFGPHAVWHVSYQSISQSWNTDLDYGSYRSSNVEIWLTAVVTDQKGCLLLHGTWSHLWYIQRSVCTHSLICISFRTYEIDYCSLFI
jgi:hypothetical protein